MIRLFIAEDQRMLLGALGSLLDLEEDMTVIGQSIERGRGATCYFEAGAGCMHYGH